MRARAGAVLAAVMVAAVAGGCGKGEPAASTASHTTPSHTTPPSKETSPPKAAPPAGSAPAKAQARAFASRVNLHPADVPGFKPTARPARTSQAERRLERQMMQCAGASGTSDALVESSSPEYQRRIEILDQSVSSSVTVAPSAADAARELATIRGSRAKACMTRFVERLLQGDRFGGARVGHVSAAQGTPPAPGADGSFGWRFTATIIDRGVGIPLYIDLLGFVSGSASVTLTSFGLPIPVPARTEERLFGLLLARAHAHPIG